MSTDGLPEEWPPKPPPEVEIPKTKPGQIWMAMKMISFKDFYHMGEMPCVRNAFLIGITSGVGIMAIRWTRTSAYWAANWGAGAFVVTSSGSFIICQSRFKQEQRTMRTIKEQFPERHVRTAKQRAEEARAKAEADGGSAGEGKAGGDTS